MAGKFHSSRSRWFIRTGAILVVSLLVFWRPLRQACLSYFLLRVEAPSEEVLSDVIKGRKPQAILERLWLTQRIPHRQFVLGYVGRVSASQPELFRAMEPVFLEATSDVDFTSRQLAFAALSRMKHPELRRLALEQLADPDPAVRLLGAQSLKNIITSNDVPLAIRLLSDPEPRVVAAAGLLLRQAIGQDLGLKPGQAQPRFTFIVTNPPSPPDLQGISEGVQRWRDWWSIHEAEYPASLPIISKRSGPKYLPTPDFALEQAAGQKVRLSDYRGKVALLAFWALDVPASLDFPTLKSLQQHNPQCLTIFGICIPPAASCAEAHEHGGKEEHGPGHHHDHSSAQAPIQQQMRALIQEMTHKSAPNFPMLLDANGRIGARYKVEDLPTYVLIDGQGQIRRRFVGIRDEKVLQAFIDEVAPSGPRNHSPTAVPKTTKS